MIKLILICKSLGMYYYILFDNDTVDLFSFNNKPLYFDYIIIIIIHTPLLYVRKKLLFYSILYDIYFNDINSINLI